jgi:hypothetical protein
MVVLSHFRVPSDSGDSVGTVKTDTSSRSTGGLEENAVMRGWPAARMLARRTAYLVKMLLVGKEVSLPQHTI